MLLAVTNVIYAIPALALFVLLGPSLGFTNDKPIVVAMTLYTLVILVRNTVEGIRAVPEPVLRSADAMGYRPFHRFRALELPLALPSIIAGLRLATVSTVSLISVGAIIGRGGLGRMFADGHARRINVELWAALRGDRRPGRAARPGGLRRRPQRHAVGAPAHGGNPVKAIVDGFLWLLDPGNWTGNDGIGRAVAEHVWYSLLATGAAVVIGLPIGIAIGHTGHGRFIAANVAGVWRAIPTVGVVTIVFRWAPLSVWPVLAALVVLAIPPIVLNTVAGFDSIAPDIRDAARGMGFTGRQAMWHVEVPNALPLILAGMRSAANQVIATATIAGFVGLGTLGEFIFTASGTQQYDVMAGASIAVIVLVLAVEALFALLQRFAVSEGVRARTPRRVRATATLPPIVPALAPDSADG